MRTITAKTIVSGYRDTGWFGSNYNMNIYKGCSHGCIYCDSRSECYRVENFDEVRAKENALAIIEHDLKSKRKTGIVITGSMSDAYNPYEKEQELTRGALKLIDKYVFGIVIDTKSDLVLRDMDLLLKIKEHSPAVVNFTITTADDNLCRKIERNVPVTSERLTAIKRLSEAGIMTGILLMPILPFINDTKDNIIGIVRSVHANGAKFIYPGPPSSFGVTLRQNQRDYFYEQLDKLFPGMKQKYIKTYGNTYVCNSPNVKLLWEEFKLECNRLGLMYDMDDIILHINTCYLDPQLKLF
jgi:DNA repair photolyase